MTIQASLGLEDLRREGIASAGAGETLGVFEFGDDEDYFLFQPEPGLSYRITVDSPADTVLGVFDTPFLEQVIDDDQSGPGDAPAIILDVGLRPVTVLLEVDTAFSDEPGEGEGALGPFEPYALVIEEIAPLPIDTEGEDIVGDTLDTAGGIAAGETVAEFVETPEDVDWYVAWLDRDRAYGIDLTAVSGTLLPFLQVQAPGGPVVAEAFADLDLAGLVFEPAVSGFHVLTVSDETLNGFGEYELALSDLGASLADPGDQVADGIGVAESIEVGLVEPGRIETAGDVDVYGVLLEEGSEYALGAVGYGTFDPELSVLDDTGAELRFVDNSGGTIDAQIFSFVADYTGLHFLEVGGAFGSTGDFDIGVVLEDPAFALPSEVREIALIYEAGLDRPADVGGLNFWVRQFEDGASLRQIANAFLDSPEFRETVGNPGFLSDVELVRGLYENVLDRAADQPGLDFWLSVLDQPGTGPDDLLIAFARSGENVANAVGLDDIVYDDVFGEWVFA